MCPSSNHSHGSSRRNFLKTAVLGGLAAASMPGIKAFGAESTAAPAAKPVKTSRVALTHGEDHANNIFRALNEFKEVIRREIGDRRVIIKPNNVVIDNPLCATPSASVEAVLEFLKSIGKTNVILAESAAGGPTLDGFSNYGYMPLARKYNVKMVDLDQEAVDTVQVIDQNDFQPHAMPTSKLLLDRNNYIISATRFKTHDRVVATLSLKNVVVGAPVKDVGFSWGQGAKPGTKNYKMLVHGGGIHGINYNIFALASRLHPDLAVLDGYEGMEGEGPVFGSPVQHRVAVVSPDWLAADRVALELMGIDFAKVGYLNYCAAAKMGEADLAKIEIVGPAIKDHIKPYKLARSIEQQLTWQKPVRG